MEQALNQKHPRLVINHFYHDLNLTLVESTVFKWTMRATAFETSDHMYGCISREPHYTINYKTI